jgi:hypothetical protein
LAILRFDPKTKQVERDRQKFFCVLGECVGLWAFLDRELFKVTRTALATDNVRAATVFYGLNSINAHLNLVDRLLRHGLTQFDFLNKWRPLHKKIVRHLETRSVYAHQPVKQTGTGKSSRAFYYFSIHIEPAERLVRTGHSGLGGKDELVAKDLRKHAHSLQKLVTEISEFHDYFRHHRKSGAPGSVYV